MFRYGIFVLMFVVWPGLGGCSKSERYPEAYGVYAFDGKDWVELRKATSTVSHEFPADVRFLIHDKRVDRSPAAALSLKRNYFVRHNITQEPGGGNRQIASIEKWEIDPKSPVIEGQVLPVQGQRDMVIFRPRHPLKAGTYSVDAFGERLQAFFVGGRPLHTTISQSEHCMDKVQTRGFGLPMGVPDEFVPCGSFVAQQTTRPTTALTSNNKVDSIKADQLRAQADQGNRSAETELRRLAEQGNVKAQSHLGDVYFRNGNPSKEDFMQAVKWWHVAANNGDCSAQGQTGNNYREDVGTRKKDVVRALMWLTVVAAHCPGQFTNAAQELDSIAKDMQMTSAQIAEAQRMAKDCSQRAYKHCD